MSTQWGVRILITLVLTGSGGLLMARFSSMEKAFDSGSERMEKKLDAFNATVSSMAQDLSSVKTHIKTMAAAGYVPRAEFELYKEEIRAEIKAAMANSPWAKDRDEWSRWRGKVDAILEKR